LWNYRSPELENVDFDFTLGRGHEVVDARLGHDWRGILLGDGYSGFRAVCRKRGIPEAGCWMHARRKFHDALREAPADAARIVAMIGELYDVERQAKKEKLGPDALLLLRRELRDLLERVCTHPASRVEELIPRHWRELSKKGALESLDR
jgi:hypothetical protein